jgi:hypothetical protein
LFPFLIQFLKILQAFCIYSTFLYSDILQFWQTFQRRFKGLTQTLKKAYAKQMLLTPKAEQGLADWMKFLGFIGPFLWKQTVGTKVVDLRGRVPGKGWIHRFIKQHPDVKKRQPASLNSSQEQAFNYLVVQKYYEKLREVLKKHGILWENVFNMDEKGIQLGGGRKETPMKYFFSCDNCTGYIHACHSTRICNSALVLHISLCLHDCHEEQH